MEEQLIQLTAGQGPEECARAVARVLDEFLKEARAQKLETQVLETVPGHLPHTFLSALVLVKGKGAQAFANQWQGTIQWIAPSPFRKYHKRKNWFIGLQAVQVAGTFQWREQDVVYESMRASGPGGQHVNKTESAVRARHVPSGLMVVASERRSQHQNKEEARQRLQEKLQFWHVQQAAQLAKEQWLQHYGLTRGNAAKTFTGRL
ncbi:peptide chain release factor H [Rufibacter sp. LB8]|uniref:peptide chain release factor H n=1 Tax=Rufibacter sp. LB8 TaxID=2777781 RepID=UPI00178C6C5A|nr:peptide chain release factor H [Rufibacter sp. LB8]